MRFSTLEFDRVIVLLFLFFAGLSACGDDAPVVQGEVPDEEIWDVINDKTAAPITENSGKSESFSQGSFDTKDFVPTFDLPDKNTLIEMPNIRPLDERESGMA